MDDNRQLRICFAMFAAYPLFNSDVNETFGGSEVELYNLATWMAGFENIRVDFIVGDYGQEDIEIRRNVRLIKVRYMNLKRYTALKFKILRYFNLFRVLLLQRSQIYMTKTTSELLGWLVIIEKILKRKKVVYRLGSDSDSDPDFLKKYSRLYYLYRLGLKRSNLVYSQSNDQKRMLKERYGIQSRVIRNAFHVKRDDAEYDRRHILWVSRCMPLKRPLLFLELVKNLPEEKFVMIMPNEYKTELSVKKRIELITSEVKRVAEEIGNLEYLEYIPFNKIQPYYDNAKLFVNTSEYEGFPNSFIQACLGNTGILSLRVDPDDFLMNYGIGYCCRDDVKEAVRFIKSLDDKKIEEMGSNAKGYVMRNHDVSTIGRLYLEDFQRLLG